MGAEYDNLIRYFMKKSSIKLKDRALHESRLNNTMSTSSRSTRTRKNIKPSTLSNDALANQMNIGMNDEDDEKSERRSKKKKKKKNSKDEDDDMMVESDQD